MNWPKEYDRAIRQVTEWMAALDREQSATVDSIVQGWNSELINRRADLRDAHLAAQELLAHSWSKEELQEATKVVGNLVCLAAGCESLRRQMSDTAHIEKALSERRQITAHKLEEARAELVRIIRATGRFARETDAYSLPPTAIVELQALASQEYAADLAELDRAAA